MAQGSCNPGRLKFQATTNKTNKIGERTMTDLRTPSLRGCFCCGPSSPPLSNPGRRGFLLGVRALALSAVAGSGGASAQATDTKPFRIDVHHHLSPPTY